MGYGSRQLDMAHALSPHAGLGDFHAASVADHPLVSDFLVLTAMAFPVLVGSENLLTEQSVPLGLQRPVVDRLGLHDFAVGPFTNLIR